MTDDFSADLPPAIPAATVVVVRDGDDGLEVLMLHRNSRIAFGGMWVFPGGRIDEADAAAAGTHDPFEVARCAAAREAFEEGDLTLDPADLVAFSYWEPPPVIERRYATWFFLAAARAGHEGEVNVDGSEIEDHAWLHPTEVLARRDRGEIELAPPTWVTLHDLAVHADVEAALAAARTRADAVPSYVTHWSQVDGGAVAMWSGDAGYDTSDPDVAGARHRLWMTGDRWRLERTS